jgi:carbamoyltransferase
MIIWGINALNHDASIAVFKDSKLVFWDRSSSYTGVVGDQHLCSDLITDAFHAGGGIGPNKIVWYERPWLKKLRQLRAGQWRWAFNLDELPSRYLKRIGLVYAKIEYVDHHLSHAAAGFLTSPFKEAAIVVLDAIGEFECASVWKGQGTDIKKVWSQRYPNSLGLFYSAFTHLLGFVPTKEEHLLQKLSYEGDWSLYYDRVKAYVGKNLHRGVRDWSAPVDYTNRKHIAAAVQRVFEQEAQKVIERAIPLSKNIVYMGGCALNTRYTEKVANQFVGTWSLPSPGDSSSSIGAVLWKEKNRIEWDRPLAKHIEIKYNN